MKALCTFSTIEDFWRYFNHIPKPSEVFFDGDCHKRVGEKNEKIEEYSLFKKGIEPEWGDPRNCDGGEWFWRTNLDSDVLDLFWQNMVLGVVGETLENGGGVVFSLFRVYVSASGGDSPLAQSKVSS